MTERQEPELEQEFYTPSEAVRYLREKRGIIYTVTTLRDLRLKGRATPSRILHRTSLWTREQLDAIKPTKRTKRVPVKPEEEENDRGNGTGTSVRLMSPLPRRSFQHGKPSKPSRTRAVGIRREHQRVGV